MHKAVKFARVLSALAATVLLTACAANRNGESTFVLVRAQAFTPSVRFTDTYPAEWTRDTPSGMESIPIGGYYIGRFYVEDVLSGKLNRDRLEIKFTMASMYVHMPDMFMVLELKADGTAMASWWDTAEHGFCLNQKSLELVHMTKGGVAARQKYPCKLKGS